MKGLVYSRQALKMLRRIPTNTSRLIRSKLSQYAQHPSSMDNNVKTLKGDSGVLRLRVGDWRVLFTEDGEVIAVIKIASRGAAYD